MFFRHQRTFGLFTLLVMSWAAVWCCCVASVRAQSPGIRPCCAEPVACPVHDSADHRHAPAECPLVQVRQTAVAPVAVVLPALDFAVALPQWLGNAVRPIVVPAVASVTDRIAAPTGPPTLLALHTALLW